MECLLGRILLTNLDYHSFKSHRNYSPWDDRTLHNKNKGMNQGNRPIIRSVVRFCQSILTRIIPYLKREYPNSIQFKSIQSIYSLQSLFCYSDNKNFCKPTGKRSQ